MLGALSTKHALFVNIAGSGRRMARCSRRSKVVQRVLGHATASMTMDLYGHLMDASLREAARAIGGILGQLNSRARTSTTPELTKAPDRYGAVGGAAYRNRTDDLRITSASL